MNRVWFRFGVGYPARNKGPETIVRLVRESRRRRTIFVVIIIFFFVISLNLTISPTAYAVHPRSHAAPSIFTRIRRAPGFPPGVEIFPIETRQIEIITV